MSLFPSDWDDEEDDEFEGNIEELVREFEGKQREDFTSRELLEIFRYYSYNTGITDAAPGFTRIKRVLELGITQFPYMPVFAIHLAEVLIRENNFRMARKYIHQAREYNAFEPALFFIDAVIFALEGRTEKANDMLNRGLELAGNDEAVLEDLLELLIFYGQFDMALPVLEKSLEIGSDVNYIMEKWLNHTEDKHLVAAVIPMLERMVDQSPYAEDTWYLLGSAFMELEEHAKAEWAFDYAVTINDTFHEAWIGYLEAVYENEKYKEFLQLLAEQTPRFPAGAFDELQGLQAWSLYETGDIKGSRTHYREVLRKNPQDSESWYSMGLTWHYEQNFSAALPYLEKAWELNPEEADYGIVLAAAYFGMHEAEKWEAIYETLAAEHPNEEEVWLDWSLALWETGQTDRALETTQNGLKHNPGNARIMYRLAAMCYLTGQQAAAEYLLETALTFHAEDHTQMFIFAPELKKAASLLRIIARFTNPGLSA
ncbi:MAG: tetratricopeptide repeat protein [Bacteroidetes bacterium]|nr:tetratricopeptide repeat protein [Bacteroidota bacterium]